MIDYLALARDTAQDINASTDEGQWVDEEKATKFIDAALRAVVEQVAREQRGKIASLPRYQEHDVVKRSSMTEYLDAEDVEEAL